MDTFFDVLSPEEILESGAKAHPSAVIARGVELSDEVEIGPHAVVGPKVQLGKNVVVGVGAVVSGRTVVGAGSRIYPYATVGGAPQDLKYAGEDTELVIGSGNSIREYVNISLGTKGGGGRTVIGDNNLFMAYTHVAHDCLIGNDCVFANGVQIAGHVTISNNVVFGGMSGGHQFCMFGEYAMVGAGAIVVQDVPPYCMVQGDRASISGINIVGLRRSGIGVKNINSIKEMFRFIYKENLTLEDAIAKIEAEVTESEYREKFVNFLKQSERGICR